MKPLLCAVTVLLLCLAGRLCDAADKKKTLIPRRLLLGNVDHKSVRISNDGRWLTDLAPHQSVMNIFAQELPTGARFRLTDVRHRGIKTYWWLPDNETIIYAEDNDGDENWRLTLINVKSGHTLPLTEPRGVMAEVLALSPLVPDYVIIGLNDRDQRFHDAYKVDIHTGEKELLFRNDLYSSVYFDMELNPRIGLNETRQATKQYFLLEQNDTSGFRAIPYKTLNSDEGLLSRPIRFHQNGNIVYWTSNEHSDNTALIAEDLTTGKTETLCRFAKGDIYSVTGHPMTGEPVLVTAAYTLPEMRLLQPEIQHEYSLLSNWLCSPCWIHVTSTTLDFQTWVLAVSNDTHPISYYLYELNAEGRPPKFLFYMVEEALKYERAASKVIEVQTRDNLTEVCFFIFPPDLVNSDGYPLRPLPTVVNVHGGPWTQEVWGFSWHSQILANRGYAVIHCNYRGSTGYGKRYVAASHGEWGRNMQYDLLDAVDYAVNCNYTLRERVAIMGGSYGGYATLAALAFTPEVFACGIDIVGPSNLITLINSIPPYWEPLYYGFVHRLGGSPTTEEGIEFLKSRSPLFYADRISKPLLIAQGTNDPRVKQRESDQIVAALGSRNVSVTYLLYPDEGHGFARSENRLALWSFIEPFLQRCLGGAAQPVESDREGSSVFVTEFGQITSTTTATTQ